MRETSTETMDQEVQPGMGEAERVEVATGLPRRILTLTVNLLVISEVFVAMFFAAKDPDTLTPVFFKVFFSLLLPTIVGAWAARRLIARREGS